MDFTISNQERIDLKRLIRQSDCEDNTEKIRKLKHSTKIKNDLSRFLKFKKENEKMFQERPEEFEMEAQVIANFLYLNYSDLFKRLVKDELNLGIFAKFLHILAGIEDGKVDQHEASVLVGRVLKELYLDSAARHGANLDKKYEEEAKLAGIEPEPPKNEGRSISWKEYKTKER